MVAVAWIRREMRERDNRSILEASREHDVVIPFYAVDEDYFDSAELGFPRVKFWAESLRELEERLSGQDGKSLVIRRGDPAEELERLVKEAGADEVFHPASYSHYGRKRDERAAERAEAEFTEVKDVAVFHRSEILTNKGEPYSVYSYYRDKWFNRETPRPADPEEYRTTELDSEEAPSPEEMGYERPEELQELPEGGRSAGLELLEEFMERIGEYDEQRDLAAEDSTSRLSPHLKFGTVSPREAFWEAERAKARGTEEDGVRTWQEELAWRDFYLQMLWHHPETTEKAFLEKYRSLDWHGKKEAPERWRRWAEGRTGYPFVDAGIRQLRATGWMHNRLRMVATSFACKDLWLDWRDVHDYYSRRFVDADLASMVGGIQWCYSIGTDAQPYFRVFNPVTQGERYDPDGEYVRRWVPELSEIPGEQVHRPWELSEEEQEELGCVVGEDYPERIVDHGEMRERAIERFEAASESD